MQVYTSHHVDAGERRPDGGYDYHYEYDLMVFSEGDRSLVARSYCDTPLEAHFLRVEVHSRGRPLKRSDVRDALAVEAVAYLRTLGKTEINWLGGSSGGYGPVPATSDG